MMSDKRAFNLASDKNFPGCVSLFVVVKFFTFAESVALHTHQFFVSSLIHLQIHVFSSFLYFIIYCRIFSFSLHQQLTLPVLHQTPLMSTPTPTLPLSRLSLMTFLGARCSKPNGGQLQDYFMIMATGHAAVPGYVVICIIC